MKNIKSLISKGLLAGLFSAVALFGLTNTAQAAQIDYSNPGNLPSIETPVFNTYTNVPNGVANEADFVRIRPSTGDPIDNGTNGAKNMLYTNKLAVPCAVGAKYDVRTYIHNGADDDFNANGTGSAVAHGVKLAMSAPLGQSSTTFKFSSTVSASNAASVSDDATLLCDNNVELKLIPQTVKIYSKSLGYNTLPNSAVNGTTSIGSNVLGSGDVWGCWDSRVIVVYAVEVVAAKEPVKKCDSLTSVAIADRKYRFTVNATAQNGATISEYQFNFGDGKTATSTTNTIEHEYTAAGNYTVTASVKFMVNGQSYVVTGDNCVKQVTIEKEPETPVYTCDTFTLTLIKDRSYKYEIKATAKGGATIKGYEYNFGDNTEVVKTDKNTVEHTYAKDGTYTSVVTVVFMVDGQEKKVTNDNCKKTVSFEHNKPMCDLPGKGHLPKDSPECKVLGVTTLPKTGAGSIIGLMASVTVAGSALHRRMTLRRNS